MATSSPPTAGTRSRSRTGASAAPWGAISWARSTACWTAIGPRIRSWWRRAGSRTRPPSRTSPPCTPGSRGTSSWSSPTRRRSAPGTTDERLRDTVDRQLAAADLLVLNKCDRVADERCEAAGVLAPRPGPRPGHPHRRRRRPDGVAGRGSRGRRGSVKGRRRSRPLPPVPVAVRAVPGSGRPRPPSRRLRGAVATSAPRQGLRPLGRQPAGKGVGLRCRAGVAGRPGEREGGRDRCLVTAGGSARSGPRHRLHRPRRPSPRGRSPRRPAPGIARNELAAGPRPRRLISRPPAAAPLRRLSRRRSRSWGRCGRRLRCPTPGRRGGRPGPPRAGRRRGSRSRPACRTRSSRSPYRA